MSWSNRAYPINSHPGPARSWSLARRLVKWYACATFLVVLGITAFLYWGLIRSLEAGDEDVLGERIQVLRSLLRQGAAKDAEVRWEVEAEWAGVEEPTVYLRILDSHLTPVIETYPMTEVAPAHLFPRPAGAALPSPMERITGPSGRVLRLMTAEAAGAKAGERWVIQAALDLSGDQALLDRYRYWMAVALAAAALIGFGVGFRITRKGLRPLADIVETTRRIRSSTLNERVPQTGLPTELATLAASFNEMLERLDDSFSRLSRFSADIAHELRTPLNVLSGEAEVALRRARPAEEYRAVLVSSLEEYAHLSKIVDSLLFIALSETSATVVSETIEVADELREIGDFYEPVAAERQVALTLQFPPQLRLHADRALFRRAVSNVVSNAIAYTPGGGRIAVSAFRRNAGVCVEVQDTGIGIGPEHLPHIFDRFYRVERARDRNSGGAGLGLSIVKTIMELHAGKADVASAPGGGTRVTLVFPLVAT